MFTTPNRWFPVELHTFLPFLHWLPDARYRAVLRRLGHAYFADVANLNLLDGQTLLDLFPAERQNRLFRMAPTGLSLVTSNLVCVSILRDGPPF